MVTRSLDGENENSHRFPKLLPLQCGWYIVSWRTWLFYASWHDPSDPRPWLGARDMTSQPRVVSLQATWHPWMPLSISSIVTCEKCHELQLRMVVGPVCKPQLHISREWEMIRCSKALTFRLLLENWSIATNSTTTWNIVTKLINCCDMCVVLQQIYFVVTNN
jgi:hypothetical protein